MKHTALQHGQEALLRSKPQKEIGKLSPELNSLEFQHTPIPTQHISPWRGQGTFLSRGHQPLRWPGPLAALRPHLSVPSHTFCAAYAQQSVYLGRNLGKHKADASESRLPSGTHRFFPQQEVMEGIHPTLMYQVSTTHRHGATAEWDRGPHTTHQLAERMGR